MLLLHQIIHSNTGDGDDGETGQAEDDEAGGQEEVLPPRKRNPSPRRKAAEEAEEARRRAATPPVAKRRKPGRPPKDRSKDAPETKRGRVGRPRKERSAESAKHTKRRVGRPRKAKAGNGTDASGEPQGGGATMAGNGTEASGQPQGGCAPIAAAQPRPSTAAAEGAGTVARCLATGDRVDAVLDSGSGTSRTYSVTIGTRGGTDIPLRLFDDMSAWLDEWGVRGVVSVERGELHGHLHLQCVVTLGVRKQYTDEAKELAALRKKIRVDNGWTTADRVKITIKRLQRGQTFNSECRRRLLFLFVAVC